MRSKCDFQNDIIFQSQTAKNYRNFDVIAYE